MSINILDGMFFKQQNIEVKKEFVQDEFIEQIVNIYKDKGYIVNTIKKGNVNIIDIEKNKGGIGMFFGKEETITIHCEQQDNILTLDYSNGAWLGKLIGCGFGVILCFVPTVKSIIGIINQNKLYKSIVENAEKLAK